MQPTRRTVLAAGLVGVASACTAAKKATPLAVDPDLALVNAARLREQGLLDAYAQVAAAFPKLSEELFALSAQHATHLAALGLSSPSPSAVPASPVAAPSPRRDSSPAALAALAHLKALEQTAADQHAAAALRASRALAPVLASLSACEASHATVLSAR